MTHAKDEAIKLALEEIKELVNQYVQIPKHHSSAKTLTILEQALAAQPAVPDAIGPNEDELPAYAAGWNDCRAEMLKGMKP
jgi:hypothetical protein